MSHFAAVFAREGRSWTAEEIELTEVEDLDGLVDLATSVSDDALLVAVEEDDEWLALVRIDGDGDARVFLSDTRVLATSEIAGLFADALATGSPAGGDEDGDDADLADDDEDANVVLDAEPGGDPGLLSDLGVTAAALLALCAQEGALPGDVTAAVSERLGAAEAYDALRGG